jgi:hypothetical protein
MPQPTPTWTDIGTFAVLAAQLGALGIAAWIARSQVAEARRLRRDQARPFVVVDLHLVERSQAIHIVISNLGKTTAENVRLAFEPALASSLDNEPRMVAPSQLKVFREGIPSLPPGRRIEIMFDIFHQRSEQNLPDVYRVTASYYSPSLREHLTDPSVLDLGIYRDVLLETRRDLHDVHEELERLRRAVEHLGGR